MLSNTSGLRSLRHYVKLVARTSMHVALCQMGTPKPRGQRGQGDNMARDGLFRFKAPRLLILTQHLTRFVTKALTEPECPFTRSVVQ